MVLGDAIYNVTNMHGNVIQIRYFLIQNYELAYLATETSHVVMNSYIKNLKLKF